MTAEQLAMDADFWQTYGGLQYAATPADASESEQDAVAYRGWLDSIHDRALHLWGRADGQGVLPAFGEDGSI